MNIEQACLAIRTFIGKGGLYSDWYVGLAFQNPQKNGRQTITYSKSVDKKTVDLAYWELNSLYEAKKVIEWFTRLGVKERSLEEGGNVVVAYSHGFSPTQDASMEECAEFRIETKEVEPDWSTVTLEKGWGNSTRAAWLLAILASVGGYFAEDLLTGKWNVVVNAGAFFGVVAAVLCWLVVETIVGLLSNSDNKERERPSLCLAIWLLIILSCLGGCQAGKLNFGRWGATNGVVLALVLYGLYYERRYNTLLKEKIKRLKEARFREVTKEKGEWKKLATNIRAVLVAHCDKQKALSPALSTAQQCLDSAVKAIKPPRYSSFWDNWTAALSYLQEFCNSCHKIEDTRSQYQEHMKVLQGQRRLHNCPPLSLPNGSLPDPGDVIKRVKKLHQDVDGDTTFVTHWLQIRGESRPWERYSNLRETFARLPGDCEKIWGNVKAKVERPPLVDVEFEKLGSGLTITTNVSNIKGEVARDKEMEMAPEAVVTGYEEKKLSFHPELLASRALAQRVLERIDMQWLRDYAAIDLSHDEYGLEVNGIKEEENAKRIEDELKKLFPEWRYIRRFYWECLDSGWKVEIQKEPWPWLDEDV